jgi:hypothetical protein
MLVYVIGRRAGRGQSCFEMAVHSVHRGSSLQAVIMAKPGAKWDYTFWGRDCTISIGWGEGGSAIGGRWRYDIPTATLFADDSGAEAVFPGAGRWRLNKGQDHSSY